MLKYLYSVKDIGSGVFGPIVERRAMADVVRDLTEMVNDQTPGKQTPYAKYPDSFALYRVGQFDDERGTMAAKAEPEFIMSLREVMLNTHPLYEGKDGTPAKGASVTTAALEAAKKRDRENAKKGFNLEGPHASAGKAANNG